MNEKIDSNFEKKKERFRLSFKLDGIIRRGVGAAGIEHDKIPLELNNGLRELIETALAQSPLVNSELSIKEQERIEELRKSASRTNPYKEQERIKSDIWQLVEIQLNTILQLSPEIKDKFRNVVYDIIDDEIKKGQQRREHDEEWKRRNTY